MTSKNSLKVLEGLDDLDTFLEDSGSGKENSADSAEKQEELAKQSDPEDISPILKEFDTSGGQWIKEAGDREELPQKTLSTMMQVKGQDASHESLDEKFYDSFSTPTRSRSQSSNGIDVKVDIAAPVKTEQVETDLDTTYADDFVEESVHPETTENSSRDDPVQKFELKNKEVKPDILGTSFSSREIPPIKENVDQKVPVVESFGGTTRILPIEPQVQEAEPDFELELESIRTSLDDIETSLDVTDTNFVRDLAASASKNARNKIVKSPNSNDGKNEVKAKTKPSRGGVGDEVEMARRELEFMQSKYDETKSEFDKTKVELYELKEKYSKMFEENKILLAETEDLKKSILLPVRSKEIDSSTKDVSAPSDGEAKRLNDLVEEQERLINGFQVENQRLVKQLKEIQDNHKQEKIAWEKTKLDLNRELNRLKNDRHVNERSVLETVPDVEEIKANVERILRKDIEAELRASLEEETKKSFNKQRELFRLEKLELKRQIESLKTQFNKSKPSFRTNIPIFKGRFTSPTTRGKVEEPNPANKQVEQLEKENKLLNELNEKLSVELKDLKILEAEYKDRIQDSDISHRRMNEKVAFLESKLGDNTLNQISLHDDSSLKFDLEEQRKQIDRLTSMLYDARKENASLQDQLRTQGKDVGNSISGSMKKVTELNDEISRLSSHNSKLVTNLKELELENSRLKQLDQQVKLLQDRNLSLERSNKQLQIREISLKAENEHLADKLTTFESLNSQYLAQLKEYKKLIANNSELSLKMERAVATAETKLNELKFKCFELQERLDSELENKRDYEAKREALNKLNSDLESDNSDLKKQLQFYKTMSARDENSAEVVFAWETIFNRVVELETKIHYREKSLQSYNSKLSAEYKKYKTQLERKNDFIRNLRREFEELKRGNHYHGTQYVHEDDSVISFPVLEEIK
jgi:chromosome segregation ATPase